MGRVERGAILARQSWGVMRAQPAALALPLVAALVEGAVAAGYVLGVTGTDALAHRSVGHYIALYPLLVILTLIATFANAAIVAVADASLRGAPISVQRALSDTVGRLPLLLGWALLSATVGLVLRILEERLPLAGRIAAAIAGIAWTLATVLAIPVLVCEGVGPVTAVRRSGQLFRERWGESLTGQVAIGIPVLLVGLPLFALALIVGVGTNSVAVAVVLIALAVGVMTALGGTLGSVFSTALYRFAVDGTAPHGFYDEYLAQSYRPRKRRRRGFSGS
jgi:hypothetical protein